MYLCGHCAQPHTEGGGRGAKSDAPRGTVMGHLRQPHNNSRAEQVNPTRFSSYVNSLGVDRRHWEAWGRNRGVCFEGWEGKRADSREYEFSRARDMCVLDAFPLFLNAAIEGTSDLLVCNPADSVILAT